jgi:hypothetical protein
MGVFQVYMRKQAGNFRVYEEARKVGVQGARSVRFSKCWWVPQEASQLLVPRLDFQQDY